MPGRKKRILHISKNNSLEEPLLKKGFEYRHFNYTNFYPDEFLDMYQRIFNICVEYKPHLILLQFEHEQCVNETELSALKQFAVTLSIYG